MLALLDVGQAIRCPQSLEDASAERADQHFDRAPLLRRLGGKSRLDQACR